MQKLFYRAGVALVLMGPLPETSAQVIIDGINVVSEFYGPFTKNEFAKAFLDFLIFQKAAKIEGKVWLKLLLNVHGEVAESIIQKSAHPLLDLAARVAVLKVKFTPAMMQSGPVPVWVSIPVNFNLDAIKAQQLSISQSVEVYGRKFIFMKFGEKYMLVEDGCTPATMQEIEYLSKAHFELLYSRPELLKFSCSFKEIGCIIDPFWRKCAVIKIQNHVSR